MMFLMNNYLQRARATTKKIETPADVDGFPELNDPEKQEIKDLIKECVTSKPPPKTKKAVRTTPTGDTSGQSLYNTDSVHVHCSKLIFYCRPNSFMLAGSSAGWMTFPAFTCIQYNTLYITTVYNCHDSALYIFAFVVPQVNLRASHLEVVQDRQPPHPVPHPLQLILPTRITCLVSSGLSVDA